MNIRFGPRHAKAQKKKHSLEQQILAHLKKKGTARYDALSARIAPNHTAAVRPVLHSLKEYGYIDVSGDKMVTITTFGLQQLDPQGILNRVDQ
jgi:predicted ArsR family transcriptional regulator